MASPRARAQVRPPGGMNGESVTTVRVGCVATQRRYKQQQLQLQQLLLLQCCLARDSRVTQLTRLHSAGWRHSSCIRPSVRPTVRGPLSGRLPRRSQRDYTAMHCVRRVIIKTFDGPLYEINRRRYQRTAAWRQRRLRGPRGRDRLRFAERRRRWTIRRTTFSIPFTVFRWID